MLYSHDIVGIVKCLTALLHVSYYVRNIFIDIFIHINIKTFTWLLGDNTQFSLSYAILCEISLLMRHYIVICIIIKVYYFI